MSQPQNLSVPMLYLEIVQGSTQFPNRPVYEGVFLIGSGSNCDLRLGGSSTAAVHSIVRAERDGIHIESLSRKPALRVNGTPCERVQLRDGDRIQIGGIQLVARFQDSSFAEVAVPAPAEDLSGISTERLLQLLEEDLTLVEEHEHAQANGAAALIEAAKHAAATPHEDTAGDQIRIVDPDEELHDSAAEAEQLVVALTRIADDLNLRVEHLQKKETVYSEAAEELLAMQNRFASLLERVLERLEPNTEDYRRSA